jgi:hypothetical protein
VDQDQRQAVGQEACWRRVTYSKLGKSRIDLLSHYRNFTLHDGNVNFTESYQESYAAIKIIGCDHLIFEGNSLILLSLASGILI